MSPRARQAGVQPLRTYDEPGGCHGQVRQY